MKKMIMATVIASLTLAGTAYASAPAMDVTAGQGQLGYSYNSLKTDVDGIGDLGTLKANNFQVAYGITDKLAVTGDFIKSESKDFYSYGYGYLSDMSFSANEIGLQYKLNENTAVTVGNVLSKVKANDRSVSTNEIFAGVAYNAAIADNIGSYASYVRSENITDWKAGVTYALANNITLDAGYRSIANDDLGIKAKGMGFGANYKF